MYRQERNQGLVTCQEGDAGSFQKFCNFLVQCESITQSSQWNPLGTLGVIFMLLSKLPGILRDKWIRLVMKVKRKGQRQIILCAFIDFISEETMLVNGPLFSKEVIEQRISIFVISS